MRYRSLTLILAGLLLVGCSSTSRVFQKEPSVPVIQKVEVVKYRDLPAEHLRRGTPARAQDRSVKEYVRVANTNTPLLLQCYGQLEAIEKLQSE